MANRKKSTRRPGKPTASARVIGEAELVIIARMKLRHRPAPEIAELLGVDEKTVRHHYEHTIRPSFRHVLNRTAEEEMARIDEIERIAWECFDKSLEPQTRETIKTGLIEGLKGNSKSKAKKLGTIESVLTTIHTNGDTSWINVIQWCVEERCKIKGHYAAQRLQINHGGEIRVAGKSREDLDRELHQRIAFIMNNREERARLAAAYGSEN